MEEFELQEKEIERGLFVARYRVQIRIGFTLLLVLVVGSILLISGNSIFKLALTTQQLENLMKGVVTNEINWAAVHQAEKPQDIVLGKVYMYARGNETYDYFVEVTNPNTNWALRNFDYQFLSGNQSLVSGSDFLMPGEHRYVGIIGFHSATPLATADSLRRSGLEWERVTTSFPDVWEITEKPAYKARQIISDGGRTITVPPSVRWSAKNVYTRTIRQPQWQVVLHQAGKPVALLEVQGEDVAYNKDKTYEIAIYDNLGIIDKVEVFPVIDFFSQDLFYLPDIEPGVLR